MGEIVKRTGTFKSFDGASIYFESRGEGRPIVLAYGLACTMNHWICQIRRFSSEYQVIALDYRGHHRSGSPEKRENLTIDAICLDIAELCRFLGVERASFWGHSFGAQILVRLFDMRPELVHDLVLVNGFVSNPIQNMFGLDVAAPAFRLFKDGYGSFPETFRSIWKTSVTHPALIPLSALAGGFNLALTNLKDIEVYARGVASLDLEVFIQLFDQMTKYDGSPVLDRIDVPSLIVSGEKDGVTPPAYQEKMHERIKGSELCRVPYGSHCTQLDLPDYVNLRIEKFLAENQYGPQAAGGARSPAARKAAGPRVAPVTERTRSSRRRSRSD